MNATDKLAEALRDAATSLETIGRLAGKPYYGRDDQGEPIQTYMGHNDEVRSYAKSRAGCAREALAAHDAEQAAKAVPAGLYVGLIERLMKLSTRLGIAYEGGVEHFAASLEDRLYAICRSAEGLLDSLAAAPTPPAPEAQRREPLTDEQIAEGRYLTWAAEPDDAPEAWSFMRGARWAEKHFGIGATTGKEPGND